MQASKDFIKSSLGYLEYYDDIWPLEFIGIEK
jgi:hypothetical protein